MAATMSLKSACGASLQLRRPAVRQRATSLRVQAALPDQFTGRQFSLLATSEDATGQLAAMLAADMRAGDAYCLKGDSGAGKTSFSRAFVRAAAQNPGMDVPPPPKSLYPAEYAGVGVLPAGDATGTLPVLHFDVGGLSRPSDDECQRLAAAFPSVVSLIEWAETLREWDAAPEQRLALYFRRLPANPDADARVITVVPHTGWWEVRTDMLRANLSRTGMDSGLLMLSDDMAIQMTNGAPELLELVR